MNLSTRFGLTYRSEVGLEFEDVVSLKNIGPVLPDLLNLSGFAGSKVDIDMTIPQAVMLSGYHQLTDRWAVLGNIGWQDWSEFGKQDLTLSSTNATTFTKDLEVLIYDWIGKWHSQLSNFVDNGSESNMTDYCIYLLQTCNKLPSQKCGYHTSGGKS